MTTKKLYTDDQIAHMTVQDLLAAMDEWEINRSLAPDVAKAELAKKVGAERAAVEAG